jgi:hypothetical protein
MTVNGQSVVLTIMAMEQYFRGGRRWGTGMLHNPLNGNKCLMGAVQSVRLSTGNGSSRVPSEEIAAATECVQQAVRERGGSSIPAFNDSRPSYHDIQQVLNRAKQLAMMRYAQQLPPPPQSRPAMPYRPEPDHAVRSSSSVPQVPLSRTPRPALPYRPEPDHAVRSSSSVPQVSHSQPRPALAYRPEPDNAALLTMENLEWAAARRAPPNLPPPPPASPLRALAHQPETAMSDLWPRAREPDPVRSRRA